MTTPEFHDWGQPVGIIDQASQLTLPGQTVIPGGAVISLDVSRVASIGVNLTLVAGGGNERKQLTLEWFESNVSMGSDYLTYADSVAYGGSTATLQWDVPVRGSKCNISAKSTDAVAQPILVTGATRGLDRPYVNQKPAGLGGGVGALTGRFLLDTGAVAIPAGGTSAIFYIPPVSRRIAIRQNQTLITSLVQLAGLVYSAGAMTAAPFQYLASPAGIPLAVEIDCPGMGLELTMFNGDAAAHSTHCYVWDVS